MKIIGKPERYLNKRFKFINSYNEIYEVQHVSLMCSKDLEKTIVLRNTKDLTMIYLNETNFINYIKFNQIKFI